MAAGCQNTDSSNNEIILSSPHTHLCINTGINSRADRGGEQVESKNNKTNPTTNAGNRLVMKLCDETEEKTWGRSTSKLIKKGLAGRQAA